MLLAGAPCDLCKQLPACSSLQSVGSVALLLACQFLCSVFSQPSLPPSLFNSGPGKEKNVLVGKYSTDQFIVAVPGGTACRIAMDYTSFLVLEHCQLYQLCRQQRPSSSSGDKFNHNIHTLYMYSGALFFCCYNVKIKC